MGTILCGVDESSGAAEAVRVAAGLSEGLGLRLVLAHVAGGYRLADGAEGLTSIQARQGATRLVERITREQGLNGKAEQRSEVGDPAEVLGRIAAEERADLIVVGSRRQGWWPRKLRSGLVGGLSATSPCPVVVVPPRSGTSPE